MKFVLQLRRYFLVLEKKQMQPQKLQKNETAKNTKLFDLVSEQLSNTLLN